jgi:membrane associated rhomboid family serine protease
MVPAAKWREFPRYPVIAGTAVLAIGVTLAWWAKVDVSALFESAEIRRGQLWRLVTSIFPHLDILHLAFNVYWLWIFGTRVEQVFGHLRTAGLLLLFAVGSGSIDFAFSQGGVGLSGVGYGLFGLLWILSRRDERFRSAIDQRTTTLFVGWFFFCIFATVTHIWPVANVAHGAGAVLGVLVGIAITGSGRQFAVGGIAAIFLLGLWGSTLGRPYVNLSGRAGYEEGQWGYAALQTNHNQEAVRWFRDATRRQPRIPEMWYDLGIAYQRMGEQTLARGAFRRAHELEPTNPTYSIPTEN